MRRQPSGRACGSGSYPQARDSSAKWQRSWRTHTLLRECANKTDVSIDGWWHGVVETRFPWLWVSECVGRSQPARIKPTELGLSHTNPFNGNLRLVAATRFQTLPRTRIRVPQIASCLGTHVPENCTTRQHLKPHLSKQWYQSTIISGTQGRTGLFLYV